MRSRTTLAAIACALLLGACGQRQSESAVLAAYLKQVNKVESAMATPLQTVSKAGADFSQVERQGGSLTGLVYGSEEQQLVGAWSHLRTLRGRLAALKAPPRAAHLRSLLLQIADGQAQMTREVAQLIAFLPRYNAALQPLGPATRRLESALLAPAATTAAPGPGYASKAAALRRYQAEVDGALRRLRGLIPPAVSRPDYRGEMAALIGMSAGAGRLATALASGQTASVPVLLRQFDQAATSNQAVAAQKAEIAAVRAYDAAGTRLANLVRAADRERYRLAQLSPGA